MEQEKYDEVVRRLHKLEQHIINLILPIQEISGFLKDRGQMNELINTLRYFQTSQIQVNEVPFNMVRADMSRLSTQLDKVTEKVNETDVSQTLGEIKFIGKKLHEIEKRLDKIDKDGVPKKLVVSLDLKDYEMTKKELVIQDDFHLNEALNSISGIQAQAIIHRLGLFNVPKCTFEKLAVILNKKTSEQARVIYKKAIRLLQSKARVKNVELCYCTELQKEVIGK